MVDDILSFTGANRYLSNFWAAPFTYRKIAWPTAEHAYQAMKSPFPSIRKQMSELPTPADAKRAGKTMPIRPGWDYARLDVMADVVGAKFRQNPDLAARLLATGDAKLVEGNTWNDRFWGVCGGSGHNHLGQILMQLRSQLAKESSR